MTMICSIHYYTFKIY